MHARYYPTCILMWIALPCALMPWPSAKAGDQPEEICPAGICIVLATPERLNDPDITGGHTLAIITTHECRGGSCAGPTATSWETDTITVAVTANLLGSTKDASLSTLVSRGSVRVDRPPESYLLILRVARHQSTTFEALEAYPVKDDRVCTFRPLKAYVHTGGERVNAEPVNPPADQRTNCYSVDELKRKAW